MQNFTPNGDNNDNRNLLMAVLLAALVLIAFEAYMWWQNPKQPQQAEQTAVVETAAAPASLNDLRPQALPTNATSVAPLLDNAVQESGEIALQSELLAGRIALVGGRIDELDLLCCKKELSGDEPVALFAPSGSQSHYFDAGWLSPGGQVPDGNTPWQVARGSELTPAQPLVLQWRNDNGLVFEREFQLDNNGYVITITDRVQNASTNAQQLAHYSQIHKTDGHIKGEQPTFYHYYGPQGFAADEMHKRSYKKLQKKGTLTFDGRPSWWGMSSHYFLAAIIPDSRVTQASLRYNRVGNDDVYSAVTQGPLQILQPNQTLTYTTQLFAGPKDVDALNAANHDLNKVNSFGILHAIAKPMFDVMRWLAAATGNWGVAIIAITLLIKLITWPLASKSYKSMGKLKAIQPKMEKLKEQHGENKEAFAMAMLELYKKEKVNPASGCWPMLIQMPIFFAMYKVMLVSFDLRHAELGLWVHDLSARDPYFVLPILMGLSMMIQMRLNPPPPDPTQRQVMQLMPIIFTAMFLFFPSGLVLYWLTNNVFSVAQQWWIQRKVVA